MNSRDIVEQGMTCFQSGDISTLFTLYSEHMEYHVGGSPRIPYAGVYRGLHEIREFLTTLPQYIETTELTLKEMVCEGDTCFARVEQAGVVMRTGRPFRYQTIHKYVMEKGRFIFFQDFPDTMAMEDAFRT